MILDTSALLTILLGQQEVDEFGAAMAACVADGEELRISAATYVEAAIYVDRNGDEVRRTMFDTFLHEFSIRIEPVSAEQAMFARQAFVSFGKGRHRAALNFGDCFTYALAKATGEALLFKGGDFVLTDLARG